LALLTKVGEVNLDIEVLDHSEGQTQLQDVYVRGYQIQLSFIFLAILDDFLEVSSFTLTSERLADLRHELKPESIR
jgi:hypothetical protein